MHKIYYTQCSRSLFLSLLPEWLIHQVLYRAGGRYPNAVVVENRRPIDARILGAQHSQEIAARVRHRAQRELALFAAAGQRHNDVRQSTDVSHRYVCGEKHGEKWRGVEDF